MSLNYDYIFVFVSFFFFFSSFFLGQLCLSEKLVMDRINSAGSTSSFAHLISYQLCLQMLW